MNIRSWTLDDWNLALQVATIVFVAATVLTGGATIWVGKKAAERQSKEILELKTELANAQRKLLETQQRMMPRAFASEAFGDALTGKATGTVMIKYDPNALDAYEHIGMEMYAKLETAGWKILRPILPATPKFPSRIRPGITVEGISDTAECEKQDTPTCSLWRALEASGLEPVQGTGGTEIATDLPKGTLCIVIGPRPLLPTER